MTWRFSKAAKPGPGPEDPVTGERTIARVVSTALTAMVSEISDDALMSLDPARISGAIEWGKLGEALMPMAHPLEVIIQQAAREEIPKNRVAKASVLEALPIDLALINQMAVEYAAAHAGRLVVEISDSVRDTIRSVVTANVAGRLPRTAAAKIIREIIPLHSAWALAVDKAADRAYFDALQSGATAAAASKRAGQVAANRAKALLNRRTQNIARTEAMTAMNEGKFAGWSQNVANGWVSPDSLKEWQEGRSPCERCAPLVGEIVRWDAPFSNGQMMPPEHPSCRCTAIMLPPDEEIMEQMEVHRLAREVLAPLQNLEPRQTEMFVNMAEAFGGEMAGLQFRLKEMGSLKRKIANDAKLDAVSLQEAADSVSDALRYTMVFPEAAYAEGASAVISDLRMLGYHARVKNVWLDKGRAYQGVNVALTSPTGLKVELQFHTPASLAAKEPMHHHYEAYRTLPPGAARDAENAAMLEIGRTIPVPPDVASIGL